FLGKLLHGFRGYDAAFAAGKGSLGIVEGEKKLCPPPLAFFPQSESLLDRVLFGVQASVFNRAAGESPLIRGEVYVHRLQNKGNSALTQCQYTVADPFNS